MVTGLVVTALLTFVTFGMALAIGAFLLAVGLTLSFGTEERREATAAWFDRVMTGRGDFWDYFAAGELVGGLLTGGVRGGGRLPRPPAVLGEFVLTMEPALARSLVTVPAWAVPAGESVLGASATAGGTMVFNSALGGGRGGGNQTSHGRPVRRVRRHREGNQQVEVDGQRWHLPDGTDADAIPAADSVGNALQRAAQRLAARWRQRPRYTAQERRNIARAQRAAEATGEWWRVARFRGQARGRWVERQLKLEFPELEWSGTGVDAVDPRTGIAYEILSGTTSNMDRHAKRMADVLFRMIHF